MHHTDTIRLSRNPSLIMLDLIFQMTEQEQTRQEGAIERKRRRSCADKNRRRK